MIVSISQSRILSFQANRTNVQQRWQSGIRRFNLAIENLIFSSKNTRVRAGDFTGADSFQSRNRESYLFKNLIDDMNRTADARFNLVIENLIFSSDMNFIMHVGNDYVSISQSRILSFQD